MHAPVPAQIHRVQHNVAQSAFTSGLNVVSGVGAVLFVTLAAVCLAALRRAGQPAPVGAVEPVIEHIEDRVLATSTR